MKKDTVNLVVRFPRSLHGRLKQDAVRSGNSLNGEIIEQLEHSAEELEDAIADLKRANTQLKWFQTEFERQSSTIERLYSLMVELAQNAAKTDQVGEIVKTSVEKAMAQLGAATLMHTTKQN